MDAAKIVEGNHVSHTDEGQVDNHRSRSFVFLILRGLHPPQSVYLKLGITIDDGRFGGAGLLLVGPGPASPTITSLCAPFGVGMGLGWVE